MVVKSSEKSLSTFNVDLQGQYVEALYYLQKYGAVKTINFGEVSQSARCEYTVKMKVESTFDIRFTNDVKFVDNRFIVAGREYFVHAVKKDKNVQCIIQNKNTTKAVGFNIGVSVDDIRKKVLILLSKDEIMYVPYNIDLFFRGINQAFKYARSKAQL